MVHQHAEAPRRQLVVPVRWLISPTADACWILGSVLVSFAMYGAWQLGWASAPLLTAIWIFGFHGPHFWATVSRTYLDAEQRRQRRGLLRGSLLWFLVGPLMVGTSILLEPSTGSQGIELLFFMLAAAWAYHHVVKQHFGFMALYRAKAGEFDRRELRLHKWYLMLSLWMPGIIVLTNNHWWLASMPWMDTLRLRFGDGAVLALGGNVAVACTTIFIALQVAFVLHLVRRAVKGRGINLPEVLVVLCTVPLHWLVLSALFTTVRAPLDNFMFVPILTIYHNIQYHGLIWHYNRRYRTAPDAKRFGAAVRWNRSFLVYFVCGLLFTCATIGWNHYAGQFMARPTSVLVAAFIWGFSFAHYYLDSKIWKVSQDADLRRTLGFPEPAMSSEDLAVPPVHEPVHA